MKSDIHPKYYPNAKVTCTCGEAFETGSTLPEIKADICSKCHPFFTGEMRFLDTQGRVEKFEAARKKADAAKTKIDSKREKAQAQQVADDYEPKTLKEMMQDLSKTPAKKESASSEKAADKKKAEKDK